MKSTSSALTPRKIAEYCKGRFTLIFPEGEVRLLYSCLVDLLERAEYPPYRGSGLDLQSLSAMLDIDVERLRAHRALLQPIFDAVAREVSNVTLRPARTASRSLRPKATTPSTNSADVSATSTEKVRKKPGVRPKVIVEFPEPLDTTWNDPATFGEAIQLHARRHGETIYHLYNAVVRPEDGVNRSTLISWGRGKKIPRAAISLEILGRIERRYRLPAGYFMGLSGMPDRAPGDFDLDVISPSERRRLAWHLPEDFNRRPSQEKAEMLNWVRTVIISGSTDYRRYQAAAIRQRYAVRFSCASGPVRKSSPARTPEESGIVIAPKRLNDEMAELLRFKTSTFAAFGMQRNGVWGTETASQKVEHFGLWFGAFVAPPESEVQGLGVDAKLLTFAMMIFPQVWDWYLHWRERRRGFYTKMTSTNAAYCQNTFYEAWRTAIQRYGIYNPWTKRGAIEGLLPHGPHNVRDVLATHILKRTGSYEQASYAIQDTPDMVAQHYGRFLPQDKSEIAARILNQVWEAA